MCGIDIGKAGMVATIRVPLDKNPARRVAETRASRCTPRELRGAVLAGGQGVSSMMRS